jgi:hypothetical protein
VRRRDVLERQGGQKREAHNDAERYEAERAEVTAPGPHLAQRHEARGTETSGDDRASGGQEQGREVADGHSRGRKRAAEDDDA